MNFYDNFLTLWFHDSCSAINFGTAAIFQPIGRCLKSVWHFRWELILDILHLSLAGLIICCFFFYLHHLWYHTSICIILAGPEKKGVDGEKLRPGEIGDCCRWYCGGGGYVSFHCLPIHHGSVYRCGAWQAALKRTRPSNRDPSTQPSVIPPAGSELSVTFSRAFSTASTP